MDELICIYNNIVNPLSKIILDIGIILGIPIAVFKYVSNEYKRVIEGQYKLSSMDTEAGVKGSAYSSAFIHNRMIEEEKYKPPFYLFFLTHLATRKIKRRNVKAIETIHKNFE